MIKGECAPYNPSNRLHIDITIDTYLYPISNFRFFPGISALPPKPIPDFSLRKSKSSSAHSITRYLQSKCGRNAVSASSGFVTGNEFQEREVT
jgi:hypothetical protein